MLPKKNRLPKQDFKKVFKNGKRIHSDYFVMLFVKNAEVKVPQFGIIASLKVGKAARRNLAKRRVREILRQEIPKIATDSQIIVICKPTITTLPYEQLQEQLLTALKKGNLYKKPI